MLHRSKLIKALVVMYILFNTQVAFPRVLGGMTDANACTTAFVLRYINAQPLLTSCLTTMVGPYQKPNELQRHACAGEYHNRLSGCWFHEPDRPSVSLIPSCMIK